MDILKNLDLAQYRVVKKVQEGYKKTEVGVIPNDWVVKKIGEIAEIKTGGTPSKDNQDYWINGNIPWMVSGDVNKKIIKKVDGRITELGMEKSAAKLMPPKTVMMALNGQGKTKGTVAYSEIELTCNQSLAGFIPNNNYNSKYLYYNLQSRYFEIRNLAGDEARNGLNLGLLRDIYIPLPSDKEQQRIAEILSTVDYQMDYTDKLIEKTKELKKGLMQRLLTKGIGHKEFKKTEIGEIPVEWEVKKLLDLSLTKGEYGIGAAATGYINGNPRYLRITDIGEDSRLLNNEIKGFEESNYENYILKEGDIVFARTGNTTGKSYVYNLNDGKLVYAGFLIRFRINKNLSCINYIKYVMQTKRYWDWVSVMSTRSGQPGINSSEYGEFKVQLPSIQEQEKIANILASVDTQIEEYENKKAKLEELKKGLMQQLLTGKIRVKV